MDATPGFTLEDRNFTKFSKKVNLKINIAQQLDLLTFSLLQHLWKIVTRNFLWRRIGGFKSVQYRGKMSYPSELSNSLYTKFLFSIVFPALLIEKSHFLSQDLVMMNFALFLALLCVLFASVFASTRLGGKTLVLVDDADVQNTHSDFLQTLDDIGHTVTVSNVKQDALVIKNFDKYLYDNIIVFASRTEELGGGYIRVRDHIPFQTLYSA